MWWLLAWFEFGVLMDMLALVLCVLLQVRRAAAALLKHAQKPKSDKEQLFEGADTEYVHLSIGLRSIPHKGRNKPYRMYTVAPLPFALIALYTLA